ncbi:MAG: hypothetical protein Unbinned5081contig1002_59 [Prokaryotic dsDNA virus sp.]|nr:MAG: hypothetical protein Unbinned5081contig1002_59 [Prokaryotic dsDNA virus sp.]|tara:strand:+ start:14172 stop:15233 length:1062 start_codon:yes stop_codon:yes gene_type:complete
MIKTQIVGTGDKRVSELVTTDRGTGQLVYTQPLVDSVITGRPFLNPTFGTSLNQNVTFGGTPENINDGGDNAGWTGAAIAGAWNFTDTTDPFSGTAHVSVTSASNLDEASFTDGAETDMSNYTAITGQVNLVQYIPANNTIIVEFLNNGAPVGNTVLLDDYINTGDTGSYQSFVIPKEDLGLGGSIVDEMTITITRSGGARPTIYFDVMQIEETGSPATFTATANQGTRFKVRKILYQWVDAGTGGAAYAYNKIGAIPSLANGIVISSVQDGVTIFSSTLRQLSDFTFTGAIIDQVVDDGTNTMVTLGLSTFGDDGALLDSRRDDFFSITINDDLSGLIEFRALIQGDEEDIV